MVAILTFYFITKKRNSDYLESVIPRPDNQFSRQSDASMNMSGSRSPAMGKYIAGERKPRSRVTPLGYARDPNSLSTMQLHLSEANSFVSLV